MSNAYAIKREFIRVTSLAYASDPEKARDMGIEAEKIPEPYIFDPMEVESIGIAYLTDGKNEPVQSVQICFKSGEAIMVMEGVNEVLGLLADYISIKNP